jgi:hypothetical protein
LLARGVPREFVDGADQLGPEKVYSVDAGKMANVGAVTSLLDDK